MGRVWAIGFDLALLRQLEELQFIAILTCVGGGGRLSWQHCGEEDAGVAQQPPKSVGAEFVL